MRYLIAGILLICVLAAGVAAAQEKPLKLSQADYQDRVRGAWIGQIIGTLMGFQFEGKVASSPRVFVDQFPKKIEVAQVDDDYYYELVALRAFEKYGLDMTLDQLGQQWADNDAGSWGSSEQTRLALAKGVKGSEAGHPRYNRLWWTIGPQFSGDIYGMIAPGDPNLAGRLARKYGHINGYAEGTDGGVFVAGMVSLAFRESDSRKIVREAAKLIHPSSPYRQCLDMVISMAEQGKTADEVFQAVEDRWHIEYPPINNGVANGGLVAASVWFGGGDYLKSLNLAYRAADFSDADCNAANAGAVVGAMKGSKVLPAHLVEQLNDRIAGNRMGPVQFRNPVDERISDIIRRIATLGGKMLSANGGKVDDSAITVPYRAVATQPAEIFKLGDLMQFWNRDWKLERAGFGNRSGRCARTTFLDGDVLATYPRDEVRGLLLHRSMKLSAQPALELEVAADSGCAWQLDVYVNNSNVLRKHIEGGEGAAGRNWQKVTADISGFSGQDVDIRIYQRTLDPKEMNGGNAYWRTISAK